jgi:hypothetical protein
MNVKERATENLKGMDDYIPMLAGYLDYLQYEISDGQDRYFSGNEDFAEKFKEFYGKNLYTLPSIRRKLETCEKSEVTAIFAQMERNHEQITELKNVLAMFSFIKVMCENIANKTEEEAENLKDLFEQINTVLKTVTANCPLI